MQLQTYGMPTAYASVAAERRGVTPGCRKRLISGRGWQTGPTLDALRRRPRPPQRDAGKDQRAAGPHIRRRRAAEPYGAGRGEGAEGRSRRQPRRCAEYSWSCCGLRESKGNLDERGRYHIRATERRSRLETGKVTFRSGRRRGNCDILRGPRSKGARQGPTWCARGQPSRVWGLRYGEVLAAPHPEFEATSAWSPRRRWCAATTSIRQRPEQCPGVHRGVPLLERGANASELRRRIDAAGQAGALEKESADLGWCSTRRRARPNRRPQVVSHSSSIDRAAARPNVDGSAADYSVGASRGRGRACT